MNDARVFATAIALAIVIPLLIAIAMAQERPEHPRIAAAKADLAAAQTGRQRALGGWAPEVTFSGSARRTYLSDEINSIVSPSQIGPRTEVSVTVSQPLFRRFTVFDELALAEAIVFGKEATLQRTINEVEAEGAVIDVRLWAAEASLEIRKRFEGYARRTADMVREKSEAKAQDPAELPRALERVARSKAQTVEAKSQALEAKAAYYRHWGIPPGRTPEPADKPACTSVDACMFEAEDGPVVRETIAGVFEAELQLSRVEMSRWARIDIVGSASRTDYSHGAGGTPYDQTTNEAEVGIRVLQPLFWGVEVDADHRRAKAQLEAARERRNAAIQRVRGEAREAWTAFVGATELEVAAAAQLRSSEDAINAIRQVYASGDVGIRDVLDAEENLASAELALIRARSEKSIELIKLNALLQN